MQPNSINKLLLSNEFQDLLSDISETTLDSILEDGILKDVPIFGILFKSKNLYSTIQDKLFAKKLFKFLKQLEATELEQRQKLIEKINTDKKYRISVGEKILFLIDKCEDDDKAEILGVFFQKLISGIINYDELLRLSNSINLISSNDLQEFITADTFIESFIKSNASIYLKSGLVEFKLKSNLEKKDRAINSQDIELIYIPSELGKLLKKILKEFYR